MKLHDRSRKIGFTSDNQEIQMPAKKKAKQAAATGKPTKVKKKKTSRGK